MKATLGFIGEVAGYWIWLSLFWGFLAIISLGLNTEIGVTLTFLFIIALLGKITYGVIKN